MKLFAPLLLVLVINLSGQAQSFSANNLDRFKALIKPLPQETKWQQITWMSDLWDARARAAREGKPIVLWEMDGHPLGCT